MDKDFDYEQMLSGELYRARDIQSQNKSTHGKLLAQKINQHPIDDKEEIMKLERELFGKTGKYVYVNPPVYVDYGRHIFMGDNVYCNMDCIFLDVNTITLGNNVMVGPRVSFFTAGHPIDAEVRSTDLEFGLPIVIEDNVWIGGNAVILPGVVVGENSIVAAGSVVTKDVPKNVIVGGNPAKKIRDITDQDRDYWKERKNEYDQKKKRYTV